MSDGFPIPFETETTDQGEQKLICGVRPVLMKARLSVPAAHPLAPNKLQKPCDLGFAASPRARLGATRGMKWQETSWTCSAHHPNTRTNHHEHYEYPNQ